MADAVRRREARRAQLTAAAVGAGIAPMVPFQKGGAEYYRKFVEEMQQVIDGHTQQ